jgi:hypothetical protein
MVQLCEVCGNEYDKCIEVVFDGRTHVFDCFECAVHALAPRCDHCGCKVIGHGTEVRGKVYCCAHCGNMAGAAGLVDRVDGLAVAAR